MKKIIQSIIYFFACIINIEAQTLYGTTKYGGENGQGAIIQYIPATKHLDVAKSFESIETWPNSDFIQASNGKLYGTCRNYVGYGVSKSSLYSFDPSSSVYTKLFEFNGVNGSNPLGALTQASDGKLYGTTAEGGSNNIGVIYSFDPATSVYTKLIDFSYTDGARPNGGLVQANDGKLYGMTSSSIFSFTPSTSLYTKLSDLRDGSQPDNNTLTLASDGRLYGMTSSSIFSFTPSGAVYTTLLHIGNNAKGKLIQASNGKFYGTKGQGGDNDNGFIFSFDPAVSSFTKLIDFSNTDGSHPQAGLMQAKNGKLYGMTYAGGKNDLGVIFSYDPATSRYTKLVDFNGIDGARPRYGLIQAFDGKLYGTTFEGGGSTNGVIFSFDAAASSYTKLFDFGFNQLGANPEGSLVLASDGRLYGTTRSGGQYGAGTIYSFDPSSSTLTKLKDFTGPDGASPVGGLVQATNGKLYGTTLAGGTHGYGTIFSFNPSDHTYSKLLDFVGVSDGGWPTGDLVQASDGKLYGTSSGYSYLGYYGIVFSFDLSTGTYKKTDFDIVYNGAAPQGLLMEASDGKLYGMTEEGGSNGNGTIFSFNPATGIIKTVFAFDIYNTGGYPGGNGLIQGIDKKLYGVTALGGAHWGGVMFSFDLATFTYTKLMNFDEADVSWPTGKLLQASDGKLYGTTRMGKGGTLSMGTIYSFDPVTAGYTKLVDFNGENGASPNSAFIEVDECVMADSTWYKDADGDGYGDSTNRVKACPRPVSYVADKTDCNDNNKAIHGPVTWYRDFDKDGFGDPGRPLSSCGDSPPPGYVPDSTDCNDANNAIHAPVTYYRDFDGDGFGDPGHSINACSAVPPAGYVTDHTDCDDINKDGHVPVTWYRDFDGDGFGDPYHQSIILCSEVAPGYVRNNYDCNDREGASEPGQVRIRMCHDGWSQCVYAKDTAEKLRLGWSLGICPLQSCAGDETLMCHNGKQECVKTTQVAAKLAEPGGNWSLGPYCSGVHISTCNEAYTTYYRDFDGDGFGDPNHPISASICAVPAGYVFNNTDCNDRNKASQSPVTYYRDLDHDGFGDPYNSISFCGNVPPAGYVENNYDCYDCEGGNAPGQTRVRMCHNGWTQCIYVKDTTEKLRMGWSMGTCPLQSCAADETLMCHNGKQECVKTKDVAAKLAEAGGKWSLGPYCSGVPISNSGSNSAGKIAKTSTEKSTPAQFSLSNHPNPFAGTSTIKYELPLDSKVSIKVYDLAGRTVATLVDEYKKAGTYTVNFNATNLSSGSLFCKILATSREGQYQQTNQVVKIK